MATGSLDGPSGKLQLAAPLQGRSQGRQLDDAGPLLLTLDMKLASLELVLLASLMLQQERHMVPTRAQHVNTLVTGQPWQVGPIRTRATATCRSS